MFPVQILKMNIKLGHTFLIMVVKQIQDLRVLAQSIKITVFSKNRENNKVDQLD